MAAKKKSSKKRSTKKAAKKKPAKKRSTKKAAKKRSTKKAAKKRSTKKAAKKKPAKKRSTKKAAKKKPAKKRSTKKAAKKKPAKKRSTKKAAKKTKKKKASTSKSNKTLGKGAEVRIVRGKDSGAVGFIFWVGPNQYGPGQRFGIKDDDGQVLWADESAVELVGSAKAAPKKKAKKAPKKAAKKPKRKSSGVRARNLIVDEENLGVIVIGRVVKGVERVKQLQQLAETMHDVAGEVGVRVGVVFCSTTVNFSMDADIRWSGVLAGIVTHVYYGGDDASPAPLPASALATQKVPTELWDAVTDAGFEAPGKDQVFLAAAGWTWTSIHGNDGKSIVGADTEGSGYTRIDNIPRVMKGKEPLTIRASYC